MRVNPEHRVPDTRPPCPACDGRGHVGSMECAACYGSGRVPQVVDSGPIHIKAKSTAGG